MEAALQHTLPLAMPRQKSRRHRRFRSLRTVFALVLREISTSNGTTSGGYIWAVLEPAAGIALLTFFFSLAFRVPPLGVNFPIFYATGILPFMMYNDVSGKVAASINFSRPLLAYPSVTFVDAIVARLLIGLLTQFLVWTLVFSFITLTNDTQTSLDLGRLALSVAMCACFSLGLGTLNCFLFTAFPAWKSIWGITTRPLFLISCLLFTFQSTPLPYRDWLWYNPIVHFIGQSRSAFYPTYDASYVSPGYVFGLGFGLAAIGLACLKVTHRDLINR